MTSQGDISTAVETECYHCGDPVASGGLAHDGKFFCCAGCRAVYDILQRNNLCTYYALHEKPGVAAQPVRPNRYAYLDDPEVSARLRDFSSGMTSSSTFFIPQMHCSSCVWLLENLTSLDPGIIQSRVDFLGKRIAIRFSEQTTSFRRVVELLASLGYEPQLRLASIEQRSEPTGDKSLYYRIGIAAFCFSNIMILAFPEYLSGGTVDAELRRAFAYLTLALSLPVFFYCAAGYFTSAYRGLRHRIVNIDALVALGVLILFVRSVVDIFSQAGPGYLDSMSGLVFFLLVGKLFQHKTYESLNFERDYRSYFPLAVLVRKQTGETTVAMSGLRCGDRIVVRHDEIVPADSILLGGEAAIDYSFVTGESRVVRKKIGDIVYAGGRQTGGRIELETVKDVSQSYLTQLWNDTAFGRSNRGSLTTVATTISRYFAVGVLALGSAAAFYWFPRNPATAWDAITGVLIVACPCALALAVPFAFGTTQRILGRKGFYLKNADVVEALSRISTVVFDKTGTLTHAQAQGVTFVGDPLSKEERGMIAALVRNSHHPLSRTLLSHLGEASSYEARGFVETPNAGIEADVNNHVVRLGSRKHVGGGVGYAADEAGDENSLTETRAYVSIDGKARGFFTFVNRYRKGMEGLVTRLRNVFDVKLVSGDSDRERKRLERLLSTAVEMRFDQSPADKLSFISSLQRQNKRILMVGDGLNDAGALKKADVGVSLTDDIAAFSPACDAILDSAQLANLDGLVRFCKSTVTIVLLSFGVSFLYNLAALSIAFEGALSPVIAAILMPLSSITVVVFATGSVHLLARYRGLR